MGRLDDKVAVITGGAGGIGSAAAMRFVEEGSQVLIVDVDEEALRSTVGDIGSNQVSYCVADVSDSQATQHYVNTAVERYGGVDIYLANAGIEGKVTSIVDYDEETFDRVMAVNVRGVWLGIKYLFPVMIKRKGGSIVITSSTAGVKGSPRLSAYHASKHAVIGIMRSTALEGARHKIRVNTVNPAPIETSMMRRLEESMQPGNAEQTHSAIASNIPLRRYGEPNDIANLMLFLASDESAFLTGGVYMADGGSTA